MEVVNEVMPTRRERIDEMMQPGPDGPIYMVNLLKFKDKAEYGGMGGKPISPATRRTSCTAERL